MPEGPEIRRAADRLARAMEGERAIKISFSQTPLKRHQKALKNHRIIRIRPRGKALLTQFDNGLTIYTHNQLYGRWVVTEPGVRPDTRRELRIAIESKRKAILLYSASDIAVLDEAGLLTHPFLAKLGPDLLDEDTTVPMVLAQLEDPRFSGKHLASVLLDQGFIAGIGNYLRSEMLFSAGLLPSRKPRELSGDERQRLAESILEIGRVAYRRAGVTNDWQRVQRLKLEGLSFEARRFNVFDREGLPCWTCGELIERAQTGGRRVYVCPGCQS